MSIVIDYCEMNIIVNKILWRGPFSDGEMQGFEDEGKEPWSKECCGFRS